MGRVLIGALAAATVAIVAAYIAMKRFDTVLAADQQRIAVLQQENGALTEQNVQLRTELDKVQREQNRLKAAADELSKALETARLTGKVPPAPEADLPYPPK